MATHDHQLAIGLEWSKSELGDVSATIRRLFAPAVPTEVFLAFWRFAFERQQVFFRRLWGEPPPWTNDPIILKHRFTNAYRASDRVSQYLIRHVIYGELYAEHCGAGETFFRVMLFKLFNKIDTWRLLESHLGVLTLASFDYEQYDAILSKAMARGDRLYSAAYIMPAAPRPPGEKRKHRSHLLLLASMIRDGLAEYLESTRNMQAAFEALRRYPSIGDFLAYQFVTDLNYSPFLNHSEMEFVVPGPGARDGLAKCFTSLGGLSEVETIRLVADLQEEVFRSLGLQFKNLWGRRLQLIDCQNLFCEVSKYARISHPEQAGLTGRTRIKQQFRITGGIDAVWYPPKWGLNERLAASPGPPSMSFSPTANWST